MGKNIIILTGKVSITTSNGELVPFDNVVLSAVLAGKFHHATISKLELDSIGSDVPVYGYSLSFDSGIDLSYFSTERLSFRIKCRITDSPNGFPEYGSYVKLESDKIVPTDFLQGTIGRDVNFILPPLEEIDIPLTTGCLNPLSPLYNPCALYQPALDTSEECFNPEPYPRLEDIDTTLLPTFSLDVNSVFVPRDDTYIGRGEYKTRRPPGGTIDSTPIYTYPDDYFTVTIRNPNDEEFNLKNYAGSSVIFNLDKVILDRKEEYPIEYRTHRNILRGGRENIECTLNLIASEGGLSTSNLFYTEQTDCVVGESSVSFELPTEVNLSRVSVSISIPWRDIVTRHVCLKDIQIINPDDNSELKIEPHENQCVDLNNNQWDIVNHGRTHSFDIDWYRGATYFSGGFARPTIDDSRDGQRLGTHWWFHADTELDNNPIDCPSYSGPEADCPDFYCRWEVSDPWTDPDEDERTQNNLQDIPMGQCIDDYENVFKTHGFKPIRTQDEYLDQKFCHIDGDEWPVIPDPRPDQCPEPDELGLHINEFSAQNDSFLGTDFFEIYNSSDETVDLNGWSFSDGGDEVKLTTSLEIPPKGFALVLADDCDDNGDWSGTLNCCDGPNNPSGCITHGQYASGTDGGIQIDNLVNNIYTSILEDEGFNSDIPVIRVEFKLSGGGESIILKNPSGETVDSVTWNTSNAGCGAASSYARQCDGVGVSGTLEGHGGSGDGDDGWACSSQGITPGMSNEIWFGECMNYSRRLASTFVIGQGIAATWDPNQPPDGGWVGNAAPGVSFSNGRLGPTTWGYSTWDEMRRAYVYGMNPYDFNNEVTDSNTFGQFNWLFLMTEPGLDSYGNSITGLTTRVQNSWLDNFSYGNYKQVFSNGRRTSHATAIYPLPCKEYLYRPINTLESLQDGWEKSGLLYFQTGGIIINAIDSDGDEVGDGWLGTLTELDPTIAYMYEYKQSYLNVDAVQENPIIFDMSYDLCGVCSGGDTFHIPNEDLDDIARNDNMVLEALPEWSDDFNDIVFYDTTENGPVIDGLNLYSSITDYFLGETEENKFQCCLYPHTIETYYEKYVPMDIPGSDIIELEEFGRTWLNSIRVCTSRGEYVDWDIELLTFCDWDSTEIDSTCKRFYSKFSSCSPSETEDVLGNCIDLSYQTPAVVDKLGNVCYEGNIDLCGVCFGNSDGLDLDGNPLTYDLLNNEFTCIPEECPAGETTAQVYLDQFSISDYETMNGSVRIYIQTQTPISSFSFDITGIEATSARIIKQNLPIAGGHTDVPFEEVIEDFEISTLTEPLLTGETISRVLGFTNSFDTVIEPLNENSFYYLHIDFEDVRFSNIVDLGQLYSSYFGIDVEISNIGDPYGIFVDPIWGCMDENGFNFNPYATHDCEGTPSGDDLSCCEVTYEFFPFESLLYTYFTSTVGNLSWSTLDLWFQNVPSIGEIETYLPGLLAPAGNYLNSDWAADHYGLGQDYLISDNFLFMSDFYFGNHDQQAYVGNNYDDLDHWLNSRLDIDGRDGVVDRFENLLYRGQYGEFNWYGHNDALNHEWAEDYYYLVNRYDFLEEFYIGEEVDYSFCNVSECNDITYDNLDNWLMENYGGLDDSDGNSIPNKLPLVLEAFESGGEIIEYPPIYIRGDATGGYTTVSYPFSNNFVEADFIEVLNNSVEEGEFTFGDQLVIYTGDYLSGYQYLGSWFPITADTFSPIIPGIGIIFTNVSSDVTIKWSLPT